MAPLLQGVCGGLSGEGRFTWGLIGPVSQEHSVPRAEGEPGQMTVRSVGSQQGSGVEGSGRSPRASVGLRRLGGACVVLCGQGKLLEGLGPVGAMCSVI